MSSLVFKKELLAYLGELLVERVNELKNAINNQREGSEGTSSAGDKHNTEQAMQHIELEKKQQQLANDLNFLSVWKRLSIQKTPSKTIGLGTLVKTNQGNFFFSVPLGKTNFKNEEVFLISIVSPLGKALKGLEKGSKIVWNHKTLEVLDLT